MTGTVVVTVLVVELIDVYVVPEVTVTEISVV